MLIILEIPVYYPSPCILRYGYAGLSKSSGPEQPVMWWPNYWHTLETSHSGPARHISSCIRRKSSYPPFVCITLRWKVHPVTDGCYWPDVTELKWKFQCRIYQLSSIPGNIRACGYAWTRSSTWYTEKIFVQIIRGWMYIKPTNENIWHLPLQNSQAV